MIFHKKGNPKAYDPQIHQGWNEGKHAKGSQREWLGYPQRKAHQTQGGSLSRNPTSYNCQIDQAEERLSETEDQLNEIKQEGKIREKRVKINK